MIVTSRLQTVIRYEISFADALQDRYKRLQAANGGSDVKTWSAAGIQSFVFPILKAVSRCLRRFHRHRCLEKSAIVSEFPVRVVDGVPYPSLGI